MSIELSSLQCLAVVVALLKRDLQMNRNLIVVANSKGGCGKTTVSIHLAETLAMHGLTTVVADADPQGTSTLWAALGHLTATVTTVGPLTMATDLDRLCSEHDYVIVDCVPSANAVSTLAALDRAALVLIPSQTSTPDLWATTALLELLERRHPNLASLVVPNGLTATRVSRDVLDLMESSWKLSKARIGARTAYREAAASGVTVHAMSGKGASVGAKEFKDLAFEVLATLSRSNQ